MSYSDAYDAEDGVAIVGLAGRFPGARSVDEFWANLVEGRESISSFADEELDPAGAEEMSARRQPGYVRSRGILDAVDSTIGAVCAEGPSMELMLARRGP